MSFSIIFTEHAIERYVRRHAPGMTLDEARKRLEDAAASATKLKARTVRGHTQWEIVSLGVVAVTKRDPGKTEDVVVTILPAYENWLQEVIDDESAEALKKYDAEGRVRGVPNPASAEIHKKRDPSCMPKLIKHMLSVEQIVATHRLDAVRFVFGKREKTIQFIESQREATARRVVSEREKTMRHENTQELELRKCHRSLRIAVRALRRIAEQEDDHYDRRALLAKEAIDAMIAIEPAYARPEFTDDT